MVKQTKGISNIFYFNSINDVVNFIRNGKITPTYKNDPASIKETKSFTGTESYEEAEDLLLHGWDEMARELTKSLREVNTSVSFKNRNCYGVAGYQCSVPRYLQGIPTNMISKKRVPVKNKIINITKSICYSCRVNTKTIKEESVKILRLVNQLESQGYRVNLNIASVSTNNRRILEPKMNCFVIKIKDASQRMNIKQMAFPLVHPSMLRRFEFALVERLPECEFLGKSYGQTVPHEKERTLFKGTYFIPSIVEEKEITDIEKYKC